MSTKPWGGAGAWALDSEQAESSEEPPLPSLSYPSLKEAAQTKQPRKKKPVAVSLSQFHGAAAASAEPKRLTTDEMIRLPTGPRQRSQEELDTGRLGGGFRNYGGDREDNRRRGFDDEGRRGGGGRADEMSRADEADNWGAGKRSVVSTGPRNDRYGALGGGPSRAEDSDDWGVGKKSVFSSGPRNDRYSSLGGGFPRGEDSDNWGAGKKRNEEVGWGGGRITQNVQSVGERPRLVLEPPTRRDGEKVGEVSRSRPSPFGAARPREEVLAEKGVGLNASPHSSRPSSAHSNRPGSSAGSVTEEGVKPRLKANPFGDAKPRKLVLEEKGVDWRKKDLELNHGVERLETDEEKKLKEEISHLKSLAESSVDVNGASSEFSAELSRLHEEITIKERDLDLLARQLDDKLKVGQTFNSNGRPTSGAGRIDASSTRPSQSGIPEDSRNSHFSDRSRSRGGSSDVWSRPIDERRGPQGARERSYFDNRNLDRSSSRERW